MPFLVLPFKKTLKLKNTFARTVPWVNRPLNFGKKEEQNILLRKIKDKKYISNKSIIRFTYTLHLSDNF